MIQQHLNEILIGLAVAALAAIKRYLDLKTIKKENITEVCPHCLKTLRENK